MPRDIFNAIIRQLFAKRRVDVGTLSQNGLRRVSGRKQSCRSLARRSRPLRFESLSARWLLAADLENPGNPLDVNDDLTISPIDALIVINQLNRSGQIGNGGASDAIEAEGAHPLFFDVTGDQNVSAIDALRVINALNRNQPEVTFRLGNDTDREGTGTRDGRTYDIGIQGRVNFGGDNPMLFIGVVQNESLTWVDLTSSLDDNGYFNLTDEQMRSVLGDAFQSGPFELTFSPEASDFQRQETKIEVLRSPPQPNLLQRSVNEDSSISLDITSQVYAPDSDMNAIQIEILALPQFGELNVDDDHYEYRPDKNYFGADTLVYEVLDGVDTSGPVTLTLSVESVNDLPSIEAINNQLLDANDRVIRIPIVGSDEDGDSLSFGARAVVQNPLAEIRDAYGLKFVGDYYEDLSGLQEKWLRGAGNTSFFILPDGDLIEWQGSFDPTATRESLIAKLDASIYEEPSLLWDADPELSAPVAVAIEGSELVIVPNDGAYGDVTVYVLASDGEDTTSQTFTLSLYKSPDNDWSAQIAEAQLAAESLEHSGIPAFLEQLGNLESSMEGRPAAEVSGLIRKLQQMYDEGQQQIQAAETWEAEEKRLLENQLATVQLIQQELNVLQAEYDAAWSQIGQRLEVDDVVSDTDPPLFVLGTDIGPFDVGVGDVFELDMSAIHPTQRVVYYFDGDSVDLDGLGSIYYHPQTGLFHWSVPSQALGVHEFTLVAEVGTGNTASVTFQVNVVSNEPTIDSLKATPSTITDLGTDLITLTAQGVQHPSGRVDSVEFWLDADGDGKLDPDRYGPPRNNQEFYGEFIKGKDRLLGVDSQGADGWTWTGVLPDAKPGSQLVFARSEYSTQAADSYSPPVSVSVDVIETPKFDVIQKTSDLQELVNRVAVYGEANLNKLVLPQFDSSLGRLTQARVIVTATPGVTDLTYGFAPPSHSIEFDMGPVSFVGTAQAAPYSPGREYVGHQHFFHVFSKPKDFYGGDLRAFETGTQSWNAPSLVTGDVAGHDHDLGNVVFYSQVIFEYKPVEATRFYADGRSVDVYYADEALYAQWYDDGQPAGRVQLAANAGASNQWVQFAADQEGNIVAAYNKGGYTEEDVFFVAASRDGSITRGPEQLNSRTTGWYKNPALAMNVNGEGVVAWNDQDWSEFNAGRRSNPTITVMRTFSASGTDVSSEVEFLDHDGFSDYPLAAAINNSGDYVVGWKGFHTQNNVASPVDYVAVSSAGIDRNYALAMHDSGWAVTATRGLGTHELQALDPLGSPVGSKVRVSNDIGRPTELNISSDGGITVWRQKDGYESAYYRQQFQLDLQTSLAPQSVHIVDPRSLTAGKKFDVEFTLRNAGLLDAEPFNVGFYLSRDEQISPSDRLLGTVTVDSLSAESVSDEILASLTMPENTDPFWNDGTTDLHLVLSIAGGGGTISAVVPFVATERIDDGTGGDGGGDGGGPDDPDPAVFGGPYIRPEVAIDQLGNSRIQVTYDTMELIGRQMMATLRAFAKEASEADAFSLASELRAKADRIELGLDAYFDQKLEMSEARAEAEKRAQEKLAAEKSRAEAVRAAEEAREKQRRQDKIDEVQDTYDREKQERDNKIAAAETAKDAELEIQQNRYNEAVDLYNGLIDRGEDAFEKVVGFFKDPLKALRDALDAAEDVIDDAEEAFNAAKQNFLDVRKGILDEFDIIIGPLQDAVNLLPTIEEIKNGALATRDKIVGDAHSSYDSAVEKLDEEFGDDIDRVKKNAAPILKNPGLESVAKVIEDPGGALQDLTKKLEELPSSNPIGSPADLKDSLVAGTKAIAQGRLGDVVSNILPPEAVQAAGDFADWAKHLGGNSTDWVKEKGGVVSDWAKDGADKSSAWFEEKREHIEGFNWNPLKGKQHPCAEEKAKFVCMLKLDHAYNTKQATIVYQLVYAIEPGLQGEYLEEFEAILAESSEDVYRAWFADPQTVQRELSSDDVFDSVQQFAMKRFLKTHELNLDGSPSVRYIDDDTTWGEYDNQEPSRREGFRKPQWAADVQNLFSLTEEEQEFCGGCEVNEYGDILTPDGDLAGWVDPDLVVEIANETGNPNPTWHSDGETIVDDQTGKVVGSFYVPDSDEPSTYHNFDEIEIGGSSGEPSVKLPPDPDDDDQSDRPQQWGGLPGDDVHRARIEISQKFAPKLKEHAKTTADQLRQSPDFGVESFYEDLDQILRNTQSFSNGFGDGVSESIEGLASGAAALFKSETWSNFADAIEDSGTAIGHDFTQFMEDDDKLEFAKEYGSSWGDFINHSVEVVAVEFLTEWYLASPEDRWKIAGKITGVIATEIVVDAVGAGVVKKLGGAATGFGPKLNKTVDDITDSPKGKETGKLYDRYRDEGGSPDDLDELVDDVLDKTPPRLEQFKKFNTRADVEKFQNIPEGRGLDYSYVAQEYKVHLQFTKTQDGVLDRLKEAADGGAPTLSKPLGLDPKSISQLDIELGAKGKKGLVSIFEPNHPNSVSDARLKELGVSRRELNERFETRFDEFATQERLLGDKFILDQDGIVLDLDGYRFVSDNDLYAIIDADPKSPTFGQAIDPSSERGKAVLNELYRHEAVQHKPVKDPAFKHSDDPRVREKYKKLLEKNLTTGPNGGENLIQYSPGDKQYIGKADQLDIFSENDLFE